MTATDKAPQFIPSWKNRDISDAWQKAIIRIFTHLQSQAHQMGSWLGSCHPNIEQAFFQIFRPSH
jgi:hypothetical protein